jgi:hypothetical protein
MAAVWQQWGAVLVASAVGFPVAVLVVVALVRAGRPVRFAVAEVFLVAGTLPWLWMILTPDAHGARRVSLVPLNDLFAHDPVVQIGGNLLVFSALGALLPVRWPAGTARVALVAALASTTVEILQYALALGRVSSVDDVLLNTLGAVLAAQVTRAWWRSRSGDSERAAAPVR